jgi:hypothetical protein
MHRQSTSAVGSSLGVAHEALDGLLDQDMGNESSGEVEDYSKEIHLEEVCVPATRTAAKPS